MQRLIKNDWFWVVVATLIATISAVFLYWLNAGALKTFEEDTGSIISSVALGAICSVGLFSWRLFMHTVGKNKLTYGIIFGFSGALGAHLLSGLFF